MWIRRIHFRCKKTIPKTGCQPYERFCASSRYGSRPENWLNADETDLRLVLSDPHEHYQLHWTDICGCMCVWSLLQDQNVTNQHNTTRRAKHNMASTHLQGAQSTSNNSSTYVDSSYVHQHCPNCPTSQQCIGMWDVSNEGRGRARSVWNKQAQTSARRMHSFYTISMGCGYLPRGCERYSAALGSHNPHVNQRRGMSRWGVKPVRTQRISGWSKDLCQY